DVDGHAFDLGDAERVVLGVGVVGQHVAGDVAVLVATGVVVVRHRRVVDRRDGDGDSGVVGAAVAVGGGVGERRRAVEVQGGGEGEAAVGVERHGAAADGHRLADVGGAAVDLDDRERVVIGVGVVGEHAVRRDGQRGVLGRGEVIVDGVRGIRDQDDIIAA